MFEQPAIFVDIETNGQMGDRGRIIEIAMIRVEDDQIVDECTSLVNPGGSIPVWIENLTGITNSDIATAPYFEDIAERLRQLSEGAIFVAHNVRFDYSFVKSHFEAIGYKYRPKLFCTVRLSRALYPAVRGHSLEKILARHHIPVGARHRAYDDAKAIYDFTKIAVAEHGLDAFREQVALQLRTKSLPPHVDPATVNGLPDSPGIYIFRDAEGAPLYIGKSINIRDRVRSHFVNDTRIVKEMKLSQRSYKIDYQTTDTEIEALLLESALVKSLQPLFNRQLRRTTQQTILQRHIDERGYATISITNTDLSEATELDSVYGVYTSRAKAKHALESAARTYQLCPKLLSLEKTAGPCFRRQLGLCKGACTGEESRDQYNRRVELALEHTKIESWPFKSKIAVTISPERALIVDQWIIEGTVNVQSGEVERISNGFDIDTYKILRSYVRKNPSHVRLFADADAY